MSPSKKNLSLKRLCYRCWSVWGPLGLGTELRSEKNSAEWTRKGFCYSAEESAHSEAFRVPRKSQFRSSERNGMEWNSTKKWSFTGLHSISDHSDVLYILLWVVFYSAEWFGMVFREFASKLFSLPLKSSEGILRACFYFGTTERNSKLFSLPMKGSEGNSESLLLFLFNRTEFWTVFSSVEEFGTEFWELSVLWNSQNSIENNHLFRLFRLLLNYFFLGNSQP